MTQKLQIVFSVQAEGDTYTVYRATEPLKTPRDIAVAVPTRRLAEAIVAECTVQGEKMDLRKMPLTQMTLTSIDISAMHRDEVVKGIMRYGESELICQRATEPAELVAEQNRVWTPFLAWCKERFKVELRTGSGIVPFEQNPESLATLKTFVDTLDAYHLTGLSEVASISGSLVLALALLTGHATAAQVFETAELDHLWQVKKWGEDPAVENRHADIKKELEMCAQWFALLA